MKIYAGRTLTFASYAGGVPHLWIVLTEPDGAPPEVVLVSLSSDAPGKDDTVKLGLLRRPPRNGSPGASDTSS